jgi:hypothetical protein
MALTGLPHLVWLAIASHRESHGWRGLKVSAKPCHANKLTAYLSDRPTAYLDEVALTVWDQFEVRLHETNIAMMLERRRWLRKVNKRRALEANVTLLALYLTKVQHIAMDRLVFLDESASNERTGHRKRGWSPFGVDCTDLQ